MSVPTNNSHKQAAPRPPLIIGGDGRHDSLAESMVECRTALATVVAGCDKGIGYKDHNEDRVLLLPSHELLAVIDGMGGTAGGERAAEIVAEQCAAIPTDIPQAAAAAGKAMSRELPPESGAVFVAARLQSGGDELQCHIWYAGDCQLVAVRNGQPAFISPQEGMGRGTGCPTADYRRRSALPSAATYCHQRADRRRRPGQPHTYCAARGRPATAVLRRHRRQSDADRTVPVSRRQSAKRGATGYLRRHHRAYA